MADATIFAVIAEERSFTKAAARLNLSVSALSHAMRLFEERLGVKLLHRTTRSVAPTEAGELLLGQLAPALADIEEAFENVGAYRDRPAGRVRLNVHRMAAVNLIAPKLARLRQEYPDIVVELTVDDGLSDIVATGFDAGVRSGENLARDMVSVRIGPDVETVVVGSPSYLAANGRPKLPQDLARHRCIGYRFVTGGSLYRWQFSKGSRLLTVSIEPCFVTNDIELLVRAALDGIGLAYVFNNYVAQYIAAGDLVPILEDWSMPFSGDFLYYASRRQVPPSLRAVIDALRYDATAASAG